MRKLIAALALFLPAPAFAWQHTFTDDECSFGQQYEGAGSTYLLISQTKDDWTNGEIDVFVTNSEWSIKSGEKITGTIKIEETGASDGAWISDGTPIAAEHGFLMMMPKKYVIDFFDAVPSGARITKAGKLVDALDLSGSYSEWLGFKSCVRKWEDEKREADRKAAIDKIPRDPFAK